MRAFRFNPMFASVILAAALSAATVAAAQETAPVEASEAAPERDPGERMICERVKAIGSNKVERVCKTAAQRAAERDSSRASRENMNRTMEQRNVCASASCAGSR